MSWRLAVKWLFVGVGLFGGAATVAACSQLPGSRFMNCEKDDDCKERDPKAPVCWNLRCVPCAYDSDCGSGFCQQNKCQGGFKGTEDGPDEPPKNLEACLSRCSDQACFDKCNADFRPAPTP